MKPFLLALLFSLCTFYLKAQLTITKATHAPNPGDVYTTKDYDTTTTLPRQTGLNKIWNFSSLLSGTAAVTSDSFIASSSVPGGPPAGFSAANLASYQLGSSSPTYYTYYNSTATNLQSLGGASSPTAITTLTNSFIQQSFPFTYGSSFSDTFSGTTINGTVNTTESGTFTSTGTGTGTLILPNSYTLSNCLQVTSELVFPPGALGNPASLTLTTYNYYHASQRFPVLNHTDSRMVYMSFTYSNSAVTINTDVVPVGLNEESLVSSPINVYPNPAHNQLFISQEIGSSVSTFQILTTQGKLIRSYLSTEIQSGIDVSGLESGLYFIQITTGKGRFSSKFIKD